MQIRFGFQANEILLIKDHLLENTRTLHSVGIVGAPTDPVLTAHVIRASELEASNWDPDDTSKDDDLQEFSHADFILAMKMLGKEVPVSDDRILQMRLNAPRQRPAFLDARQGVVDGQQTTLAPPPNMPGFSGKISAYDPRKTEVYQIFSNVQYGQRKEGVDVKFAIPYPGVEPFPFWDMRTPDVLHNRDYKVGAGQVCMELFFFGEFNVVKNQQQFLQLVTQVLVQRAGVQPQTPLPIREAGCMYPLIAVPVVLSELDAMELGDIFFENFGEVQSRVPIRGANDANIAGPSAGCSPQ
ncbi:hypothetical protein AGDE_07029 [Angomonas deanei]|nr:hypothetical protein AGDE_07029 [Angomonas deanei]|eukprot:EPY36207.1 hypothetical protein AGDE_07029 [Angomonas deanei]